MREQKITDSELEVMQILWAKDAAQTLTQIRVALKNKTGWEDSTIKTLISRLVKKGAVTLERRDVFYYTAGITQREYKQFSEQNLINKMYSGSAKSLIASLIESQDLSEADIAELQEIIVVKSDVK